MTITREITRGATREITREISSSVVPSGPVVLVHDTLTTILDALLTSHPPEIDTVGDGWVVPGSKEFRVHVEDYAYNASGTGIDGGAYIDTGETDVKNTSTVLAGVIYNTLRTDALSGVPSWHLLAFSTLFSLFEGGVSRASVAVPSVTYPHNTVFSAKGDDFVGEYLTYTLNYTGSGNNDVTTHGFAAVTSGNSRLDEILIETNP